MLRESVKIIPDVKSWRDDKESAAISPKTFKTKVNELRQKKKSNIKNYPYDVYFSCLVEIPNGLFT